MEASAPFELGAVVYESSRSTVTRAVEVVSGRVVALKMPAWHSVLDEERAHYARAAAVSAYVGDLVPATTMSSVNGTPALIMAFVEGQTLSAYLQDGDGDTRDLSLRLTLAFSLAEAVASLHESGVAHGDLEPSNIIIDSAGQITLIDLESAVSLRADVVLEGEPHTVSPARSLERFAPGPGNIPAYDLFCLGLIFQRLFTGQEPDRVLAEGELREVVENDRSRPGPAPTTELPKALAQLLDRLLVAEPALQYPSANTLVADLRDVAQVLQRDSSGSQPVRRQRPPVLAIGGRLVGRNDEFEALAAALDRAGRHGGEGVLLSGMPGVGKSALVQAFGAQVSAANGVFAYGRYQPGGNAPYSAIGDALGQLVRAMLTAPSSESTGWRDILERELGAIASSLTPVVPDLAIALPTLPTLPDLDAEDARSRLQRAVATLISVTAGFRPVVLTIDDLQWADQDSVLLLSHVLTTAGRNVLVVGTHRAGEFDEGPIQRSAGHLLTLVLGDLSTDEIASLLADVCGQVPELDEVVAEVHRRTAGNPLHVRQLLARALATGVIRVDPRTDRRSWDLHALTSLEITNSVAELLGRAIDQLNSDEAAVLSAIACLGAEFDLSDAVAAAGGRPEAVADALWSALDLHLLEVFDPAGRRQDQVIDQTSRYRFSHDRILEAARARLTDAAQREVHVRIGRELHRKQGDDRIFQVARHISLGQSLLHEEERLSFAEVELRAARMARRQAAFPIARDCFEAGLEMIGSEGVSRQPELARQLYLGGAEAAYLVSDFNLTRQRLDDAEKILTEPADRAYIAFLRIKAYLAEHRLQDAVETGLAALRDLAEPLPSNPGKQKIVMRLIRTKLRIRGWSNTQLLALPVCHDQRVIEMQRILDQLRNIAYIVKPELFPLVVCKEVALTLDHGLVPSSAIAIASYGVLLVAIGDYTGSQRFGEVALQLAELEPCADGKPQTQFLYVNFIRHWKHPMNEGLLTLPDAYREALDRGHPEYAGFLAAVLLYQSFWVGRPLTEIDALAQTVIPPIRSQHVPSCLCQSTQQLCLNLMGRSEDPFLLAGESGYDEREVLPVAEREHDIVALSAAAITKLGLHFWYGDYAGCLPLAEETQTYLTGMSGTSNVQLYHFVNALSRLHLAPEQLATARAARRALKLHRKWAALAPANYAAPYEIIAGVRALKTGKMKKAERHLDRAIALADAHHLPVLSALAHEEMASVLASTGRESLAQVMLQTAHRKWLTAGMLARSERLEAAHRWLRSRDLVDSASGAVDFLALRQVREAVVNAANYDGLVEVVLEAIAHTTSASRVLLLMGDDEPLAVRAVWRDGVTIVDDGSNEIEHDSSVVARAVHSGGPVVAERVDLEQHNVHDDQSATTARSTLCVPIQLHARTIGALYVEDDARAGAFGPAHEEALVALCAQIAAPLRNIELERQLRAAEEHQRSLVDMQARFIPNKLLRVLDIDDIRRVRRGQRVECEMTVLISDIRGYTTLVEGMSLAEAGDLAMDFLRTVEVPIITSNGLLQDLRGDEVLAVFDTCTDDAVRAALAMQRSLRAHNKARVAKGAEEIRAGIGINVGTVALGLVGGVNRIVLTVIGDAVNLAARIESINKRYGSTVLISDQAYVQLKDPAAFHIRRMERVMVVNRRQPVTVYEVYDDDSEPLRDAKRAAQPTFDEAFAFFDDGDFESARAAFERCRALVPGDHVAELHLAHCAAIARGDMMPGQEVALAQK